MGSLLKISQRENNIWKKRERILSAAKASKQQCYTVACVTLFDVIISLYLEIYRQMFFDGKRSHSQFHNDRQGRVSQQVLFGAPFMFCQTKTREQASVRYLLRIIEYEKLQSQTLA